MRLVVVSLVLVWLPTGAARAQQHVHTAGMSHDSASASQSPRATRAGQEAFATIAEIVRLLDADPGTDWSKVDIEALRQHLLDMDDVTMRAEVRRTDVPGGAAFTVTGTGRVRDAIRRMARAHGATVTAELGMSWTSEEVPDGARVTVLSRRPADSAAVARLQALGFHGLLTLGAHHTEHHLGIANGSMRGEHEH